MNSFDAAFGQVFALATLTCQNAVHSVFRNTGAFWFVPFYKLRGPLKSLVDRTRDLDKAHQAPYRDAFLWMLFVLAGEQHYAIAHAAAGVRIDISTPAWASLQFQHALHVSGINMIQDSAVRFEAVRSILQGFLWDEEILGPLLSSMLKMCARLDRDASDGVITSTKLPSFRSWPAEQEEFTSGNGNRKSSGSSIAALESCVHSKTTALDVKRMSMGMDASRAYRSKHGTIFAPEYPAASGTTITAIHSTSEDTDSVHQQTSSHMAESKSSHLSTAIDAKSTKNSDTSGSFATIKLKPPLKWRKEAQLGPNHFRSSDCGRQRS